MDQKEYAQLPEVPDEVIERIEGRVFAAIDEERDRDRALRTPAPRRRRLWPGLVSGAAVLVLAVAIAPAAVSWLDQPRAGSEAAYDTSTGSEGGAESAEGGGEAAPHALQGEDASAPMPGEESAVDREVIRTGSASVEVVDVDAAIDDIRALVEARGGHVEGLRVTDPTAQDATLPEAGASWVTVRVPADDLDALVDALGEVGEVHDTELSAQDVTTQAVDLRARIEAAQASVDRLTELMSQAGSVSDLLEAEQSLSERQTQLESYQQELALLEGQVAMSRLTIALTTEPPVSAPDPAGFQDGLVAGWNGLVAALSGAVVALGFLLPWLGAVAILAGIGWLIVRLRRRRRGSREGAAAENRP